MDMPASLHEILVDWQAGKLSARQAMSLAGVDGFADLYLAARHSGVPLRTTLLPKEKRAADLATAAILRRSAGTPSDD